MENDVDMNMANGSRAFPLHWGRKRLVWGFWIFRRGGEGVDEIRFGLQTAYIGNSAFDFISLRICNFNYE